MADEDSRSTDKEVGHRGHETRLRVLVVDPSDRNLRVLRDSLPRHGIDVLATPSGEEALQLASALQPDVVLAEARLSDLSTEEFLQRIGAGPWQNGPVVLLMTQNPSVEEIERWLETGAQDVLRKPMFVAEIAERVKMVVRRRQQVSASVTTDQNSPGSEPEQVATLLEYVEILSAERRTGTLYVFDGYGRSGKVGLRDGNVTFAEVGGLRGEKAAYTLLSWEKATWRFEDEEPPEEENVRISTIAVILEAMRWQEAKRQLLSKLPSSTGPYRLTPRFLKLKEAGRLPTDGKAFLELIDGAKTLPEILAASPYDDRETLEKLVKMTQRGVIEPVRLVEPSLREIEASLRDQVEKGAEEREEKPEEATTEPTAAVKTEAPIAQAERWVVLIGSAGSGRSDVAMDLAGGRLVQRELRIGRRTVPIRVGDWGDGVGLLEVDTKDLSDSLLERLLPRADALVLMAGATERQKWEYIGYLYQAIRERYQRPIVVGLVGEQGESHLQNVLRETLDLKEGDRLIFVTRNDATALRAAVQVSFELGHKGAKTVSGIASG